MKNKFNNQLLFALLIPMLLLPLAGYAYAHWTDTVFKQYKFHFGFPDCEITTYKVLSPWDDNLITKWPPDDMLPTDSISISTNIFPGWYVWIGFIIQNFGNFPVLINAPIYQVSDPADIWTWFIHGEYFYGQVIDGASYGWPRTDVPRDVYANVFVQSAKQLGKPLPPNAVPPPPQGNITAPVYLDAYGPKTRNSMVMWIYLKLREDYTSPRYFFIQIKIIVNATPPPAIPWP